MLENMFSSVNSLQKGLSASWLRNEVISNNIANVDTPGFKASHVQFEDVLAESLDTNGGLDMTTTNERHIPLGGASALLNAEPEVVQDDTTSTRLDGNNVSIENEMVDLAKNSIQYYAAVSKINAEFRKLDSAINVT